MKGKYLFLAALVAVCSCTPKNVADKIKDRTLKTYCIVCSDKNKDQKISPEEASAVESIDVSGLKVSSLKGLQYFTGLKTLNISETKVEKLVVNSPSLEVLKCEKNDGLVSIDVSKCPSLNFIYASHTSLSSLDLSKQPDLCRLWVDSTPITSLNVASCPKLNNINVQNCPGLKEVVLSPDVDKEMLSVLKDDSTTIR